MLQLQCSENHMVLVQLAEAPPSTCTKPSNGVLIALWEVLGKVYQTLCGIKTTTITETVPGMQTMGLPLSFVQVYTEHVRHHIGDNRPAVITIEDMSPVQIVLHFLNHCHRVCRQHPSNVDGVHRPGHVGDLPVIYSSTQSAQGQLLPDK